MVAKSRLLNSIYWRLADIYTTSAMEKPSALYRLHGVWGGLADSGSNHLFALFINHALEAHRSV